MPRPMSRTSWNILRMLWEMPWATAAELALVLLYEENTVSTFLSRVGRGKQWVNFADLGRLGRTAHRFVFVEAGIKEMHETRGWPIRWWHTANGVDALAGRLEFLEMAYSYLPKLWVSNLVEKESCFEYVEVEYESQRSGERRKRVDLQEKNWHGGRLQSLHWLEKGPFEVIATYWKSVGRALSTTHIPVLSCTRYTRQTRPSSVFEDMGKILIEDDRRRHLGAMEAGSALYRPGCVAFCSDAVSAGMVQRDWVESISRERRAPVKLGIIEAGGQIVRRMDTPTNYWGGIQRTDKEIRLEDIGAVSDVVRSLQSGPYASVNGAPAWRMFNTLNSSPGLTIPQVRRLANVDASVAKKWSGVMETTGVIWTEGRDKSLYLDEQGVQLLASSQKVDVRRADRQWKAYREKSARYRLRQRRHNQGQAELIIILREQGYLAFANPGFSVGYGEGRNRISVIPDAFIILPPGVLIAVEYERSARAYRALDRKAMKYGELTRINCPLPVLFVTEGMNAARTLAKLGYRYLQATSIEALRQGPQGRTIESEDGWKLEEGCWCYRLPQTTKPEERIPIDFVAHLYADRESQDAWRMPLDNPFQADLRVWEDDPPWRGDPDYMPGRGRWGGGTWLV